MHISFPLYSLGQSFSTYLQTHLAATDSSGVLTQMTKVVLFCKNILSTLETLCLNQLFVPDLNTYGGVDTENTYSLKI